MRLLITGCRDGVTYGDVLIAIHLSCVKRVKEVISCGARGTDLLGECWAALHKIPIKRIPVTFSKDNPHAEQNQIDKAIKQSDFIILLSNGVSMREEYISDQSVRQSKPIFIHSIEPKPIIVNDKTNENQSHKRA